METTTTHFETIDFVTRVRSYDTYGSRRDSDVPHGRSRLYVGVENENMLENLVNRRSRPYNVWRRHVEDALRENGVTFTGMRWSQRCGCSCPCSPGFILDGARSGRDYYLTVRVSS